ncbi:MAG: glycoside hydrolase family 95 protein [Isosphaeraceae bacterium]
MMGNSAPRRRSALRDAVLTILLLVTTRVQASDPVFTGRADPPDQLLSLWHARPAGEWLEAVPVGNGRLGGMVYGGVTTERIGLNEDTLWSGGPKDCDNPQAFKTLPEIRRLIFEGKYAEAHHLGKKMMGPYTQTCLPMGDLVLTFDIPSSSGPTEIRDYRRMPDLDRGVAGVRYTIDDVVYSREVFVSQPDQILVVRLTASRPGTLGFTARLASRLHFRTQAKDNVLVLRGKAPAHVDPNYYNSPNPIVYAPTDDGEGMSFECHLRANAGEGTITVKDDALRIEHAGSVTLLLSAATSFNGCNRSPGCQGKDPAPIAAGSLAAAAGKPSASSPAASIPTSSAATRRFRWTATSPSRPALPRCCFRVTPPTARSTCFPPCPRPGPRDR